jgi:hypothetical protein
MSLFCNYSQFHYLPGQAQGHSCCWADFVQSQFKDEGRGVPIEGMMVPARFAVDGHFRGGNSVGG